MKTTIDSQHLKLFVSLARSCNMSRSAAELGLTPSALSHALKALEKDLGCRLIERSSRHFALTEVGAEFLPEAQRIIDQMTDARTRLCEWRNWREGQLRIGASGTSCELILPPTLREFRESFPAYTIKIEQCTSRESMTLLAEGHLDLVLHTRPESIGNNEFLSIGEDDLQFIANPLHPWAVKRRAVREEIPRTNLILPARGSNTYASIETYFRTEKLQIQPFIEIANEQAILEFVRLNMGVGILPRWLAMEAIQRGVLIGLPLGRRRLRREWGIMFSRGRKLSLAENLFVNISRSVFQKMTRREDA